MTNPDYTHLTILADRTGSMGDWTEPPKADINGHIDYQNSRTKASDTTRGVHDLIRAQAGLPGMLTVSLVQFNSTSVDRVAWFADAHDHRLATWTCTPYGGTPLLDAVGTVITDTGFALAQLPEDERPARVVFVIATDGEENSSHEYTLDTVKKMVTEQQERYDWQFVFLGVDIDAFAEGHKMAFSAGATMASPAAGITQTYSVTSDAIGRYRAGGQSVAFTDEERTKVTDK